MLQFLTWYSQTSARREAVANSWLSGEERASAERQAGGRDGYYPSLNWSSHRMAAQSTPGMQKGAWGLRHSEMHGFGVPTRGLMSTVSTQFPPYYCGDWGSSILTVPSSRLLFTTPARENNCCSGCFSQWKEGTGTMGNQLSRAQASKSSGGYS